MAFPLFAPSGRCDQRTIFAVGRESELAEFCKAKHNRELIESAIAFLTEYQYIANDPSFVPRKTLQWIVSQQMVQTATEPIGFTAFRWLRWISFIFLLGYFFIRGIKAMLNWLK